MQNYKEKTVYQKKKKKRRKKKAFSLVKLLKS